MIRTSILIGLIAFSVVAIAGQKTSEAEFKQLNADLLKSYSAGEYDKALAAAEKLVEIAGRESGKDSVAAALALTNRGMVEQAMQDDERAAKSFDAAIDAFKKNKTLDNNARLNLATSLESLGRIRAKTKLDWTEGLFKDALEVRELVNGPDSPATATPLVHLANIRFWQRDFTKSAELYTRALKNLGGDSKTSREDVTFVYYRTQCSYRKAKIEEQFEDLKTRYGKLAEFDTDGQAKPKLINAGVVNGKAMSLPKPKWPAEARIVPGAGGLVTVQVLINEEGRVISACGVKTDPHISLVEASEIAAYGAKFSPTVLAGKPVKVFGVISYNFSRR